jgi:hypothetical protein
MTDGAYTPISSRDASCASRQIADPPLLHIPLRTADAKRSVKNILKWNAYLPTDCVRTMVRMGWDYTT